MDTQSVLSDKDILLEKELNNIIIEPFNRDNLCTSSYDVTLGNFYFREQRPINSGLGLYNMYDREHTRQIWGDIHIAKPLSTLNIGKLNGISEDDEVILIEPGETILCHTQEFIGGKNNITTMMKCRSSLGRNFIEICKCAGWGDIGYTNRWTMEITNNSKHYTIPLVVGRRCAQIIFFKTGDVLSSTYEKDGKYQSGEDIDTIKEMWNPGDMLPKMYKDREIFN